MDEDRNGSQEVMGWFCGGGGLCQINNYELKHGCF